LETLSDAQIRTPVHRIGWPDRFVDHGSDVTSLREDAGLSQDSMLSGVRDNLRSPREAFSETEQ